MPPLFDFAALTKADIVGVGLGLTSDVVQIANSNIVAKIPAFTLGPKPHDIERRVYERLKDHPSILQYLGQALPNSPIFKGALLFEYHRRGCLEACLDQLKTIPGRQSWPHQAVSAIAYIHSMGVVHADLGLHNFLLCDDDKIVLCDFAGSGLDRANPCVAHGHCYTNLLRLLEYTDKDDDIFVLGTVLYELDRGERLFEGKGEGEIRTRLHNKQFPDLSTIALPLRSVIEKCWTLPGYQASTVLDELSVQE
ncbi:hypothetical protein B7494_g2767 [Chlorociboria aeruginascens]|nr:hypothetical protein B7494_g2767 [Chlorociboria aeruginascens]